MLTPLQEATLAIYCARFNGLSSQSEISQIHTDKMLEQSISQAKALLEACKPEPLEWKQVKGKEENATVIYSKGGEFKITSADTSVIYRGVKYQDYVGIFKTLEEAKQFAEHIRTR